MTFNETAVCEAMCGARINKCLKGVGGSDERRGESDNEGIWIQKSGCIEAYSCRTVEVNATLR
jgi:hypothetical protein